ncbi:MAG TPA: hypothetical protein VHP58_03540 [Alphaproteobacteria bacterium]|nr:hypothetical protein [Alphaproteobacteria bacterium]
MRMWAAVLIGLAMLPGLAEAADQYQVNNGATVAISEWGTCKLVKNNHASGKAIMIPTKTNPEWSSFLGNTPAGVTMKGCGPLYCWGYNSLGQLGNGGTVSQSYPVRVVSTTAISFTQVDIDNSHACGVDIDGRAYCWGSGASGVLGYGGVANQSYPVRVVSTTAISFTQVVGGSGSHTCAVDIDGKAYCWGSGATGRLGYGGTGQQNYPVRVVSTTAISFTGVTAGSTSSCGVDINGKAYCWGQGTQGQLGYGGSTSQLYPVRVVSSTAISFTQVTGGGNNHTCGVDINGNAYCWGSGASGKLGYGGTAQQNYPVRVVSTTTISFTQLSAGTSHSCGIDINGAAFCWGLNAYGQLGNGDTAQQNYPVRVVSTPSISFTQIVAGSNHSCGVGINGALYCWGQGDQGQLGNGGTAQQSYPVQVTSPTGASFVWVSAHRGDSTCAINSP